MSRTIRLAIIIAVAALASPSFAADADWSDVGKVLGKAGSEMRGGVYRVGLPRSDLKVSLDGVAIKPGFALGGWVAFQRMGSQAMVMGDVVLTQDEVNPVMKKLEESGIEITALHNHLLRAEPMTFYMHVLGHGDPVKLASALHAGLALSKTPMGDAAPAASPPACAPAIDFDTAAVDQAMGYKGKANNGIYQFSIPRRDGEGRRHGSARGDGLGDCDQLSADRRRQGRNHGRFRADLDGGEPCHQGDADKWHRDHRAAQPHARRTAARLLHAFLGQ